MTTLTLDQVQKIVYSATSSAKALFALHQAGASVYNSAFASEWYSVKVDGHCIAFSDNPKDALFYVFFDKKMVTKEVRKQFLESQQQPTDTVPAVSTAAEALPYSEPPSHDFYGSMFEAVTCVRCDRWAFEPLLSENGIRLTCLHCHQGEWIGFGRDLSAEPVDNSNPELTVFCPSCDYHSATAQKAPEADFYHVKCSQCALDGDRDTVHLSPSSLQPHQAQ
jgi:hypothetical protein